MAIVQQIRE